MGVVRNVGLANMLGNNVHILTNKIIEYHGMSIDCLLPTGKRSQELAWGHRSWKLYEMWEDLHSCSVIMFTFFPTRLLNIMVCQVAAYFLLVQSGTICRYMMVQP